MNISILLLVIILLFCFMMCTPFYSNSTPLSSSSTPLSSSSSPTDLTVVSNVIDYVPEWNGVSMNWNNCNCRNALCACQNDEDCSPFCKCKSNRGLGTLLQNNCFIQCGMSCDNNTDCPKGCPHCILGTCQSNRSLQQSNI